MVESKSGVALYESAQRYVWCHERKLRAFGIEPDDFAQDVCRHLLARVRHEEIYDMDKLVGYWAPKLLIRPVDRVVRERRRRIPWRRLVCE